MEILKHEDLTIVNLPWCCIPYGDCLHALYIKVGALHWYKTDHQYSKRKYVIRPLALNSSEPLVSLGRSIDAGSADISIRILHFSGN